MKNLWITGAGGFLGAELFRLAGETLTDWCVTGIVHNRRPPIQFASRQTLIELDLTDNAAMRREFQKSRPDAVIHLAAASNPNWCEERPDASSAINVLAALELARLCAATSVPLIFASTDLVFNGRNPPYAEIAKPNPISHYGRQKASAEVDLRFINPENLTICRLPLMFGPSAPSRSNPLDDVLQALKTEAPIKLFSDEFRTPAGTRSVSAGLLIALRNRPPILHLGGRERVSRYDFGQRLANWLGVSGKSLLQASQKDVPMAAPRPPDVSFDSSLAFSLGYSPLNLEEEWAQMPFLQPFKKSS